MEKKLTALTVIAFFTTMMIGISFAEETAEDIAKKHKEWIGKVMTGQRASLQDRTIVKSIVGPDIYGDVNMDGEITPGDALQYGDVNMDGEITPGDALLVYQHSTGGATLSPRQLMVADVNDDGQVTALDGRIIFGKYMGTVGSLPVVADVDDDGQITTSDVRVIYKYIGIDAPLPIMVDTTAPVLTLEKSAVLELQKKQSTVPNGISMTGEMASSTIPMQGPESSGQKGK